MVRKKIIAEKKVELKKENYFKKIFSIYIDSFKSIDTNYFYYVFYDLFFLVVAGGLTYLLGFVVNKFSGLAEMAAMLQSPDAAAQLAFLQQAKNALILTVIMFFVLVVLLIICWSLAKTFIYNRIYGKKFEWKPCLKFVASNIVIILAFLALLASIPAVIVQEKLPVLASIAMVLMLYFVTIYYITFFRIGKFAKAFSETLNTAVMKVHKLVIPFILLLITLVVAIGIFSAITSRLAAAAGFMKTLVNVITVVFLLFVWAWVRLYLVKTVNYVAGKE